MSCSSYYMIKNGCILITINTYMIKSSAKIININSSGKHFNEKHHLRTKACLFYIHNNAHFEYIYSKRICHF